jgi:cell division protein FtsA
MDNIIIALDFGSSNIRTVAAEVLSADKIRILSEETKKADGIRNGIIGHPSGTAFSVSTLMKEVNNSAGLRESVRHFSFALSGKGMRIVEASVEKRLNKSKPITDELIDNLAAECEKSFVKPGKLVYDIIPVIYEIDGREYENPEGLKGNYIIGHYHLVIGSEEIRYQYDKLRERMAQNGIEYMPLAAEAFSVAVTSAEERRNGCAVICFGDTSTILAVYDREILCDLLVVPFGGRTISSDIEELGMTSEHAEKLKCKKGVAMQSGVDQIVNIQVPAKEPGAPPVLVQNDFLAMIIEARLDEMMSPVFEVLETYEQGLTAGIILTGGGSELQLLREYISDRTGLQTRYGDHSHLLSEDTSPVFEHRRYAQILGTILLTHANRSLDSKSVPQEKGGTKKKPGKSNPIKRAFTQGIFKFFEEDSEIPG